MSDCSWWEVVSAAADGELPEHERVAAASHAAACPRCSSALEATAAFRPSPRPAVSADAPVLDADRLSRGERRWFGGRWARRLLVVAAIVIVVEAIPTYVRGDGLGAESHAARHLATWQIGFGVGLLVAAWVSRMSHAMLALAGTFASLTVLATIIDVIAGHRGPLLEAVHLVELVGVFLLWRLTPPHLLPWYRPPREERQDTTRRRLDLRLVKSDATDPDD